MAARGAAADHGRRRRRSRRRLPCRPRSEVDVRGRRRWYAAVAAVRRSAGVTRRHGDRDRRAGIVARASNADRRRWLGQRRRPTAVAVAVVAVVRCIGRARKSTCAAGAGSMLQSPPFDGRPASSAVMAHGDRGRMARSSARASDPNRRQFGRRDGPWPSLPSRERPRLLPPHDVRRRRPPRRIWRRRDDPPTARIKVKTFRQLSLCTKLQHMDSGGGMAPTCLDARTPCERE